MISPKIRIFGITLLILITIILSSAIYFYTTGFLSGITGTNHNIFFSMDCDSIENNVKITYSGGESIPSDIVNININGMNSDKQFNNSISPRDTIIIDNLDEGDTVSILFDTSERTYSINSCSI